MSESRRLLKPTGPFGVGCIDYEWKPEADGSTVINLPEYCLVRLHYPSSETANDSREYEARCAPWIPDSYYPVGGLKLWAVEGSALNEEGGKMPIVVLSHGMAGIRTMFSVLCCELASHGFLVAAVEHRDGSAAMTLVNGQVRPHEHPVDGISTDELFEFRHKQLVMRSEEVSATLDLLEKIDSGSETPLNVWKGSDEGPIKAMKGRLDLQNISIAGHSFGGGTAIYASNLDSRFRSVVALDAWLFSFPKDFKFETSRPLLGIISDSFHTDEMLASIINVFKLNNKAQETQEHANSILVTLANSGHHDQTDLVLALPSYFMSLLRAIRSIMSVLPKEGTVSEQTENPSATLCLNNQIVLSFLKTQFGICVSTEKEALRLPKREHQTDVRMFEESNSCIIEFPVYSQ